MIAQNDPRLHHPTPLVTAPSHHPYTPPTALTPPSHPRTPFTPYPPIKPLHTPLTTPPLRNLFPSHTPETPLHCTAEEPIKPQRAQKAPRAPPKKPLKRTKPQDLSVPTMKSTEIDDFGHPSILPQKGQETSILTYRTAARRLAHFFNNVADFRAVSRMFEHVDAFWSILEHFGKPLAPTLQPPYTPLHPPYNPPKPPLKHPLHFPYTPFTPLVPLHKP